MAGPSRAPDVQLGGLAPGLRKGIATRRGPMPVQEAKPNEDTKRIADEGNCMEVPEEGQEDTLVESAEAVLAEDVCRLAKGSVAYPNAAAEGSVELGTLFGEVNRRALDEVMVAKRRSHCWTGRMICAAPPAGPRGQGGGARRHLRQGAAQCPGRHASAFVQWYGTGV